MTFEPDSEDLEEPRIDWLGALGPTLIYGKGRTQVLSRAEQLHIKLGLIDVRTLEARYRMSLFERAKLFNKGSNL